jgi:hypothetical protein
MILVRVMAAGRSKTREFELRPATPTNHILRPVTFDSWRARLSSLACAQWSMGLSLLRCSGSIVAASDSLAIAWNGLLDLQLSHIPWWFLRWGNARHAALSDYSDTPREGNSCPAHTHPGRTLLSRRVRGGVMQAAPLFLNSGQSIWLYKIRRDLLEGGAFAIPQSFC